MLHLDLFSGIGGFAYAVDQVWPDAEHIFCDNDPFCQQVLKKHWPNSKIYGDIRGIKQESFITDTSNNNGRQSSKTRGGGTYPIGLCDTESRTFLLTGGFPCQPFSQAGRRKGTEDNRYLWPEMFRVIQLAKPQWVIAENVRGLLTIEGGLVFEQVCLDLEAEGYEVQPLIIPAVAVNAPHRRDRVWFVAKSKGSNAGQSEISNTGRERQTTSENGFGLRSESGRPDKNAPDTECTGHEGQVNQAGQSAGYNRGTQSPDWTANWFEVATRFCRVDDGLPAELDGLKLTKAGHRAQRLKALGNAIVPQVAMEILKVIATLTRNN